MAEHAWVNDITEEGFERDVLARSNDVPVVLDFWSTRCQPCMLLGPILENLAAEFDGSFVLGKVNVDRQPMLANDFGVSSIPMVVAMWEGKPVSHFVGLLPEASVREFIQGILPSEVDLQCRKAERIAAGDRNAAKQILRPIVESTPDHEIARVLLAELEIDDGDTGRARELIEPISMGSPVWDRAQRVRSKIDFRSASGAASDLAALKARAESNPENLDFRLEYALAQASAEQYEGALETLAQIIERDRDYGVKHVKEAMVKIFGIVGPQTELANRYRSRLQLALY